MATRQLWQRPDWTPRKKIEVFTQVDAHYTRDVLLERTDLNFDAVVATEDSLAIGAVKYARARGLCVPDDLAICGFNNTQLATAVRQSSPQ